MRINDSKPLPGGPTETQEEVSSSKLGDIKAVNGNTESALSTKYTMFLPDGSAQLAGNEAGNIHMSAGLLQQNLQKQLDSDLSAKNVKWEGPDLDALKSKSLTASKTRPATDGVVLDENAELKEPVSVEFPNLTAANGANSVYQHNQTNLEFLVSKKTEPKK